jgi:hypothetical protein
MQLDDTHGMRLHDHQKAHTALARRAETLDPEEQQQVQWLLADVREAIETGNTLAGHLRGASGVFSDTGIYAGLIVTYMEALDHELEKTAELIDKVENVVYELVNAELLIHEERLKYYRIQSHLAKVRILDQSLTERDGGAAEDRDDELMQPDQADPAGQNHADQQGDDHAA